MAAICLSTSIRIRSSTRVVAERLAVLAVDSVVAAVAEAHRALRTSLRTRCRSTFHRSIRRMDRSRLRLRKEPGVAAAVVVVDAAVVAVAADGVLVDAADSAPATRNA